MFIVSSVWEALQISLFMLWEVLWPLAFGFLLSAVVQVLVPKQAVARVLGRGGAGGFAFAVLFGAASSSCSYAAVALARTLFRKGANFVNAIIFEFASTNLVFELGLILLIVLRSHFVHGQFTGGLLMAVILGILFKLTLGPRLVAAASSQAEKGIVG